jgi:hypothetical protein
LPEHCFAPGAQIPWQAPDTHAWLPQSEALPHWPVGSQVWTPLPEHCFWPGVQLPAQAPETQAWLAQLAAALH